MRGFRLSIAPVHVGGEKFQTDLSHIDLPLRPNLGLGCTYLKMSSAKGAFTSTACNGGLSRGIFASLLASKGLKTRLRGTCDWVSERTACTNIHHYRLPCLVGVKPPSCRVPVVWGLHFSERWIIILEVFKILNIKILEKSLRTSLSFWMTFPGIRHMAYG